MAVNDVRLLSLPKRKFLVEVKKMWFWVNFLTVCTGLSSNNNLRTNDGGRGLKFETEFRSDVLGEHWETYSDGTILSKFIL
jgi:hypothetical protein